MTAGTVRDGDAVPPLRPPPPSGGSPKERRREQERQDILTAAGALFAEQGFRATSVQAIAACAEFSVGKIYSFYPSKEAIFDALVEAFLDRMNGLIQAFDRPDLAPLERLHHWLTGMLESGEQDRNLIRVGIVEARRGRHHYRPERRAGLVNKITELIQAAVDAGSLPPLDARMYAHMMQGAIEELTLTIGSEHEETPFREIPKLIFDLMILPLADRQARPPHEES
jgi:AcrR family transcriptional regulator